MRENSLLPSCPRSRSSQPDFEPLQSARYSSPFSICPPLQHQFSTSYSRGDLERIAEKKTKAASHYQTAVRTGYLEGSYHVCFRLWRSSQVAVTPSGEAKMPPEILAKLLSSLIVKCPGAGSLQLCTLGISLACTENPPPCRSI